MSDDSCNVAFDVAGLSAQLFTICNLVFAIITQQLHNTRCIIKQGKQSSPHKSSRVEPVREV